MLKNWLNYQKPFSVESYQFQIFALWKQAFQQGKTIWLRLLAADIILIVVMHIPMITPHLETWFPFLAVFRIHPVWENSPGLLGAFGQLSKYLFPLLYAFFVSIPVYLGVNLMALRLAYKRPAPFSLLWHYTRFFWWGNLVSVLLLAFVVFFPFVFFIFFLMAKVSYFGVSPQYYVGMAISAAAIIFLMVFFSFVLNLVFAARIPVVKAVIMSWKAVRQRFWRILGMSLISYLIWNAGERSWYLSDIFLVPANLMAWAMLYQKIFGDKGLVE